MERRWGVLFQHGALFSSLTVLENIQVPMREYLDLSPGLMEELENCFEHPIKSGKITNLLLMPTKRYGNMTRPITRQRRAISFPEYRYQ